ncbi:MAG TPA: AAA family ATPase [Candidatus Dormibacteraeota bacterium]|jgi:MinD-like ATPase involved in chromosome partitioning or flagellar assembly
MDPIEFADGFDRPDRIAFGLSGGQLAVVMVGALGAYSLVRSPLPAAFADPVAAVLVAVAAGLGWLRVGGRPVLDWAIFAGLFLLRPRRGVVRYAMAVEEVPSWFGGSKTSAIDPRAPASIPSRAPLTTEATRSAPPRSPDLEPEPISAPRAPIIELFAPRQPRPAREPTGATNVSLTARRDGPRRVTFFSLRGGTGRSTLATELACILAASHGQDVAAPKVALLDLDLRSPTVGVRLGAPEQTLLDYALAPPEDRSVRDFMITHSSGARVLLGPQRAVNPEWPVTPALLREVLRELDMEGFDLVVLDVSPDLSPLTTAAITACDDVFVVVVPTAGGVQDAYRSTEALRRLGLRHQLRYIVNRSRPGTDLTEPMADLGGQLVGDIPDDDSIVSAENAHRLVGLDDSGPAAIALRRLARRVGSELRASWPA